MNLKLRNKFENSDDDVRHANDIGSNKSRANYSATEPKQDKQHNTTHASTDMTSWRAVSQ